MMYILPLHRNILDHDLIFLQIIRNWGSRLEKSQCLEIDCQKIRRCIQIGLLCVKLDRSKRPTTSQIIKMLHEPEGEGINTRKEVSH
jgi:hypothetical protein